MNTTRMRLIEEARKLESPFWKRVASDLEKPARNRRIVNLSRLARVTKENEVVVVPGKVLGDGVLGHKLTIAALTFSDAAKDKLAQAKCTVLSLDELMKKNPKGNGRIIG